MTGFRRSVAGSIVAVALGTAILVGQGGSIGRAAAMTVVILASLCIVFLFEPRGLWLGAHLASTAGGLAVVGVLSAPSISTSVDRYALVSAVGAGVSVLGVWLASRTLNGLLSSQGLLALLGLERDRGRSTPFDIDHPYIQEQMARSRRYEKPLSVLVVDPRPTNDASAWRQLLQEIEDQVALRYATRSLAAKLAPRLRATDRLFRDDGTQRLVLVCPETKPEDARQLVERLLAQAGGHRPAVRVGVGVASFPDEALTFEELLRTAEDSLVNEANERKEAGPVAADVGRVLTSRTAAAEQSGEG